MPSLCHLHSRTASRREEPAFPAGGGPRLAVLQLGRAGAGAKRGLVGSDMGDSRYIVHIGVLVCMIFVYVYACVYDMYT